MAKSKNLEMKEFIIKQSFTLFLQQGYKQTSYQCIADSCAIKRSIVQYYFPKKQELVGLFLHKTLNMSKSIIEEKSLKNEIASINIYLVAQIYFAFLLMNKGLKRFTYDTLLDRQLTKQMMFINTSYALNMLGLPSVKDNDDFHNDAVMKIGGFYDVIFHHLDCNHNTKIQYYIIDFIANFILFVDASQVGIRSILESNQLSACDLDNICDELYSQFLVDLE